MKLARSAASRLRLRSINMPANLSGQGEESNRNEIPHGGLESSSRDEPPSSALPSLNPPGGPCGVFLSGAGQENDGVLGFSGQVIQTGLYSSPASAGLF